MTDNLSIQYSDNFKDYQHLKDWIREDITLFYSSASLFYLPSEDENCGFKFICFGWLSTAAKGSLEFTSDEDYSVPVEGLLDGSAAFDGIRHLHIVEYINYPEMRLLSAIFSRLRELEEKYCSAEEIETK